MTKTILITGVCVGLLAACKPAPDASQTANSSPTQQDDILVVAKHTDPNMTYPHAFERIPELAIPAPIAKREDTQVEMHGMTVPDPYAWLRDQDYPEVNDEPVLDYVKAENAYFQSFKAQQQPLIDTLFEEFKSRVDPNDASVPVAYNGYEYWSEYQEGSEYRVIMRRSLKDGGEQVLLDLPKMAQAHDYFVLGDYDISQDNQLIAYTINTSGDERYDLFVKDLRTGKVDETVIKGVRESVTFTADGKGVVYDNLHPERWYTTSVNLHVRGTSPEEDRILMQEDDDGFFMGHYASSDKKFVFIVSNRAEISEIHFLPLDNITESPTQLVSREQGFRAHADHAKDAFYILANDTHVNSRVAKVSTGVPSYQEWETVLQGDDSLYLTGMQLFDKGMAVELSRDGLQAIQFIPDYDVNNARDVAFSEDVFSAGLGNNRDYYADEMRVSYESMITPNTLFAVKFADLSKRVLKEKHIPAGYNANDYVTERLYAPARDGARVPISIVYRKGYQKDGKAPLFLYAYGAYGYGMSPSFSTSRLSLLESGFAYANAHTRGGDEKGLQWYVDGKLKQRQNAFNDFIDVAHYLIDQNYVQAGNISTMGRSAGGKMMGAVVTQAPNLWRSVVLGVPFVDVLNTMLDETLPLTPPEWEEWGNPITDKDAFIRILDYSPYDNIEAREYPPMLVTGGLYDPRVTYWEPAKWTAQMRATKTDNNLLMMRMNMSAGHFSNSGRYARLLDDAEEYAFVLAAHGITM